VGWGWIGLWQQLYFYVFKILKKKVYQLTNQWQIMHVTLCGI
jgi:hypothetical protein